VAAKTGAGASTITRRPTGRSSTAAEETRRAGDARFVQDQVGPAA
jgi:hypothetical protein